MKLLVYCAVYLGVALIDLFIAREAYRKKTEASIMLARVLVCAAALSVSYLASIAVPSYEIAVPANTLCLIIMEVLLAYLLRFTFALVYGSIWSKPWAIWSLRTLIVLGTIDAFSLALNPLFAHVATYHFIGPEVIPHFAFEAHWPYLLHLSFCYILIALSFVMLIVHVVRVPEMYRPPYARTLGSTSVILIANAIYLWFFSDNQADLTIAFYGLWGLAIYISVFVQGNRKVLENTCFNTLLASSQPTVIFDYKGKLIFANKVAKTLFPSIKNAGELDAITYELFMGNLHLDKLPRFDEGKQRFYWSPDASNVFSYICDYQEIRDDNANCVARSLVFTNNTLSVDPLTSFLTEQYFIANRDEFLTFDKPPIGIAVCDLNQLGLLNNVLGVKRGDDAIALQAALIRKHLPAQTIFVRLHDARLGAVCYGMSMDAIKGRLTLANEELGTTTNFNMRLRMDFAIAMVEDGKSVVDAEKEASSILKTRKLLDRGSGRSSMIDSLTQMLAECDSETESHVQRTRILGDALAFELGLSDYERDQLSLLCLFHDIGKVGIPNNILTKPAGLTDAEREIMREHVKKGYRIARATPGLEIVAEPILHHHENWDGTGYPDGLKHEDIPVLSRVISVIDSYDAMVSDRPYHKGIAPSAACAELQRCAGKQFDPYIVEAFVRLLNNEDIPADILSASHGEEMVSTTVEAPQRRIIPSQAPMMSAVEFSRYVLAPDMRIQQVDDAFERMTGYTAYDVEQQALTQADLLFEDDRSSYSALVAQEIQKRGVAYIEHRIRRKDGTGRYVYCTGIVLGKGADAKVEVIMTDITESNSMRHEVNVARNRAMMSLRRLEESIQLDPMTNVLNQSAFRKSGERELLDKSQRCVLIMSDLDDFKAYNDTYGHPKGDILLQEFARALSESVGSNDLVGRMGGDEFACLLRFDNTDSLDRITKGVEEFHERVRAGFKDTIETPTFSMGAAYLEPNESDFEELYIKADANLYTAKKAGKGQLCW